MPAPIADQVVDFFNQQFEALFSQPFRRVISNPIKRNAVIRQIGEAADAASQSLKRLFDSERLAESRVEDILASYAQMVSRLSIENVSNPHVAPESVVEDLLRGTTYPESVRDSVYESVFRLGLHSVVQVLMLVGPVMAEWRKLVFSSAFEMPRKVVSRLNQISDQIGVIAQHGHGAADERYELGYRDYLLQRFHRVEAGTVKMTTNLDVDLRELFVMPRVRPRTVERGSAEGESSAPATLEVARGWLVENLVPTPASRPSTEARTKNPTALEWVRENRRAIIVGAPGGGKSTFVEWLQVQLAGVEEKFVLSGRQAIPVLLRIRQLDPRNLPSGSALIEKATASKDRADLMPRAWISRQMREGRVLLIVDGLDETEPQLRDEFVLPWLAALCREFPECGYLVSSRPVGYPAGVLRNLDFVEAELLDFDGPQVREYTNHWCTAIRLARNEPDDEARREGAADGELIVAGFKDHPYVKDLARNPLMLSAICLVNYFEHGSLPRDRVLLYKLCVEGLLHHWDHRRGISSQFALQEKLLVS